MPKFQTLAVTVASAEVAFQPAENGATSVWLNAGETLNDGSTVTYSRRPVTSKQTTRKSAFGLTIPFHTECPTTCEITSRGTALFKLDNVVDARVTLAEREEAYDTFVQLLLHADVKDAIINNGSFYS